jgi:hypothetical protein
MAPHFQHSLMLDLSFVGIESAALCAELESGKHGSGQAMSSPTRSPVKAHPTLSMLPPTEMRLALMAVSQP